MIGDPSGKDKERQLIPEDELAENVARIETQLRKFLDLEGDNAAVILNNNDWFSEVRFLDFLRDTGKHLTVSYMLSKESVKRRLESGISYTEFSYQVLQAEDYWHLFKNHKCTMQMGGSDQWGNITAGIELVRRKEGKEVYGFTCPLLTRTDGSKFGKSEGRNIWLHEEMTSPYEFYQFWLNATDEEAARYTRVFSLKDQAQIEALETKHATAPHERALQHSLARELTSRVHSAETCELAEKATEILFGKATKETLVSISEEDLLSIFAGVDQVKIARSLLEGELKVLDFLADSTQIFPSKGEARRMIEGGGVSINKEKIANQDDAIGTKDLLSDKYLLVQRGKKHYTLVILE